MDHDTFDHWLKANYSRSAISIEGFTDTDLRSAWLAGAAAEREALFTRVRAAVGKISASDAEALYALLGGVE